MKVKELIKMLENENQDAIVIMSSDGEGNSHSPFADFSNCDTYKADSTWSGEVGFSKLTPQLKKDGYGEGDILQDGEPALILCPVN